ncbi:MAG: DUF2258 domain-containing protein [Desulfurococcales archaeon]|nr:DUF2258 domain-containing protein [Desulfurococcales archaeon]
MATLRTGLVIAGAYADKVRRVLFAQLRDMVKSGEVSNTEVARAAGDLNRLLFDILVNRLSINKGDVVRITVDYEVSDGRVEWRLDTLQVQAWRMVPEEEVNEAVRSAISMAEDIMTGAIDFDARRLGETDTGDVVYEILHQDRVVGAMLATPIDEGEALVRGAVTEPTPLVLKRTRIQYTGSLDEFIASRITAIMEEAANTERRDAEKVVREIRALIMAAGEGRGGEEL